MKKTAFTLRSDGRIQAAVKLPGMKKPKFFYGKSDAEVKRKIAAFSMDQQHGRRMSVICDDWQGEHFEEIAYNTMRSYLAPCKDFLEVFGDSPSGSITPQDLNKFIRLYAKKGYSKKTVKNMMSVMRMLFDYAVLMGDVNISPMTAVKLPPGLSGGSREMPSTEEIQIIKDSVDLPFGLFPYFLMYSGCRPGEALAIRSEDIDRQSNTIHVTKSVYHIGNKPILKEPKTEKGVRSVVLLDRLADKIPKFSGYLFGGETPLSKKAYNHRWQQYRKKAGLDITPYQLRHVFATMLYEAGIDEKEAQQLMGHAQLSTTRDIYTHIRKEKNDATRIKLNAFDF